MESDITVHNPHIAKNNINPENNIEVTKKSNKGSKARIIQLLYSLCYQYTSF